jgi:type III restriction enzyme
LDKIIDNELDKLVEKIFASKGIFVKPTIKVVNKFIGRNNNHVNLKTKNNQDIETNLGIVNYGEFLKRLNQQTNLPINILHSGIIKINKRKKITNNLFNIATINNIVEVFEKMLSSS